MLDLNDKYVKKLNEYLIDEFVEKRYFKNTSTINFSDLKCINTKDFPYAVTMKDTYMSSLSSESGLSTKFIHLCVDREMAEYMASYARTRSDTKYISVTPLKCISQSFFSKHTRVQLKTYDRLSAWTEDSRYYHPELFEKDYINKLEDPHRTIFLNRLASSQTIGELKKTAEEYNDYPYLKKSFIEQAERVKDIYSNISLSKEDFEDIYTACYKKKLNSNSEKLPNELSVAAHALRPFTNLSHGVDIAQTNVEFEKLVSALAEKACRDYGREYIPSQKSKTISNKLNYSGIDERKKSMKNDSGIES